MKYSNKNSGFTIIETLIAIVIFSFSVVGMVTVAAGGISDLTLARNRLVANYLAQEGVELVRNMRETYLLNSNNTWSGFYTAMTSTCTSTVACAIDGTQLDGNPVSLSLPLIQTCPSPVSGACLIKEDGTTSSYGPTIGTGTVFSRAISFLPAGANLNAIRIRVVVRWQHGLSQQNVSVGEVIYNWE